MKKLKEGMEKYVEFPIGTTCMLYERHKEKYTDYNLLGQALKLQCQLTKTNFDSPADVEKLKRVAEEVANTIKELIK